MRKKVAFVMIGIIIGIIVGVVVVYPGIFAWTHNMNLCEVWYGMFS